MFFTTEPRPRQLGLPTPVQDALLSIAVTEADLVPFLGPANRLATPARMAEVEAHLLDAFAAIGWQVARQPVQNGGATGANVVALKPAWGAARPGLGRHMVVVGAHFDTVDGTPGADDNAAGVAALIALARALAPLRFERSIALVAFDFEETGFAGSLAFVEAHRSAVSAALILECIAYADQRANSQLVPRGFELLYGQQIARLRAREHRGDSLAVLYNRASKELAATLAGASQPNDLPTIALHNPTDVPLLGYILRRYFPAARHFARSDHLAFWRAGIPALQLTDTADFRNPHYHAPTDTPDTLDYTFLSKVVRATALAVIHLAGIQEP